MPNLPTSSAKTKKERKAFSTDLRARRTLREHMEVLRNSCNPPSVDKPRSYTFSANYTLALMVLHQSSHAMSCIAFEMKLIKLSGILGHPSPYGVSVWPCLRRTSRYRRCWTPAVCPDTRTTVVAAPLLISSFSRPKETNTSYRSSTQVCN